MHKLTPSLMFSATLVVALAEMCAGATTEAATAPDGRIAYSSWDTEGNYDIYVVDPDNASAEPIRLTTDGRYNANPDWSPDGTRIVYEGWSTFAGPRIQVMDTDPATDDPTVVSEPCAAGIDCYGDFQPAWSPDGTRIAFVSSRPNGDDTDDWGYEIYVMDSIGEVGSLANATRLTTDVADEFGASAADSQATWSPDGRRIAFLSTGRGADPDACDLWVMDAQDRDGDGTGDDMRRLTFDDSFNCDAFEDVSPQWAPSSSLIAFTSVRSGYFDIWVVDADDPADLRNVTQTPNGYEDQPGWSPDGTQILFRSSASGAYEIYSLPVPPAPVAVRTQMRSEGAVGAPTQRTFDGKPKQQADWGPVPASAPGTATLTASKRGRGHVRTVPRGIRCGRDCAATFVARSSVRVTAKPAAGYGFERWGGACAGTLPSCTVRLKRSKSVIARFVTTPVPTDTR